MPIVMYKKIGETPLQVLDRLRLEDSKLAINKDINGRNTSVPLTYAGRLDPMAEGLLLVLVGEECKGKDKYLGLDKEYECEILWGVETDTYDILGLINKDNTKSIKFNLFEENKLKKLLQSFVGKRSQNFPPYSSKPVQGKPLYKWAREDRLGEIELPQKDIEIKYIDLLQNFEISKEKIKEIILERINLVKGDFRQKEIIENWQNFFKNTKSKSFAEFFITKIIIQCSSGTYVRELVKEIGKKSGFGATVFALKRKRVGHFKIY